MYPCKQDETRAAGLGQPSEEEDGEEASNSNLPPEEILERGEWRNRKRNEKTRGTSCNKKNSTWGVRHKLFHLQSGRNSEAAPGEVVGTPSFETFGTWLDDVLSNLMF